MEKKNPPVQKGEPHGQPLNSVAEKVDSALSSEPTTGDGAVLPSNHRKPGLPTNTPWWTRNHNHVYGVIGVVGLALSVIFYYLPIGGPSTNHGPNSKLGVRVLRGEQVFVDVADAVPLVSGDQLRLSGSFDVPVYAGLVWIDQQGNLKLIANSGKNRTKTIRYPEGEDTWLTLEGGSGTEMILLLAAETPLIDVPVDLQKLRAGKTLAKLDQPATIWINREKTVTRTERVRAPGAVVKQAIADVVYQADQVREVLQKQTADFHGIAFPHQ